MSKRKNHKHDYNADAEAIAKGKNLPSPPLPYAKKSSSPEEAVAGAKPRVPDPMHGRFRNAEGVISSD